MILCAKHVPKSRVCTFKTRSSIWLAVATNTYPFVKIFQKQTSLPLCPWNFNLKIVLPSRSQRSEHFGKMYVDRYIDIPYCKSTTDNSYIMAVFSLVTISSRPPLPLTLLLMIRKYRYVNKSVLLECCQTHFSHIFMSAFSFKFSRSSGDLILSFITCNLSFIIFKYIYDFCYGLLAGNQIRLSLKKDSADLAPNPRVSDIHLK